MLTDYLGLCGGGWLPGFVCGWTADAINWSDEGIRYIGSSLFEAWQSFNDFTGAVGNWVSEKLNEIKSTLELTLSAVNTWTHTALHALDNAYHSATNWLSRHWEEVLIGVALFVVAVTFAVATWGIGGAAIADIVASYTAAQAGDGIALADAAMGAAHFGFVVGGPSVATSTFIAGDIWYICSSFACSSKPKHKQK